jgi:hypothetical protein
MHIHIYDMTLANCVKRIKPNESSFNLPAFNAMLQIACYDPFDALTCYYPNGFWLNGYIATNISFDTERLHRLRIVVLIKIRWKLADNNQHKMTINKISFILIHPFISYPTFCSKNKTRYNIYNVVNFIRDSVGSGGLAIIIKVVY